MPQNVILYLDNCLAVLPTIQDKEIDCILTSPPYDNLRDYKKEYAFEFEPIAKELCRVLKDGGHLVWVVGDETNDFCETLSSFKQALFFVETCGLNLLDTMIYYKTNYAPAYPTLKRYANQFEYMFVFTKGKPTVYNPIQVSKAELSTKQRLGKYRQKDGSFVEKNMLVDTGRNTKDASNVWEICPTKDKYAGDHPAVFPLQLALNHILSWTNENDLVLDPMMGSGTVGTACVMTKRRFIGIEMVEEYFDIAKKRIELEQSQLRLA